jgi:hypothetical protein
MRPIWGLIGLDGPEPFVCGVARREHPALQICGTERSISYFGRKYIPPLSPPVKRDFAIGLTIEPYRPVLGRPSCSDFTPLPSTTPQEQTTGEKME